MKNKVDRNQPPTADLIGAHSVCRNAVRQARAAASRIASVSMP
jgi:hypothetical protein